MIRLRILVVSFLVLSLNGCAFLNSLDSNLPAKIDQLTEQQEYGLALDTLEYIKPSNDNYKLLMQKKRHIQRLATSFENTSISKARRLSNRNKWNDALLVYDSALDKLPRSQKLLEAKEDFLQKRQAYLKELELQLLINKGEWLDQNAPLHHKVKATIPDDYRSVPGIRDYEYDTEDTLPALVDCTETAITADEIHLAQQCLTLAKKLGGDVKQDPRLAAAQQKIHQANRDLIEKQNEKTRALLAELKQGYSLENLRRANEHLAILNKRNARDKESIRLRRELNHRLQSSLDQRIEAARSLYSSGKIEQALQIWESLQTIAPDNTKLEAHIERAHRVLDKLERLHKEGSAVVPPEAVN
jgi:hypothetical protein